MGEQGGGASQALASALRDLHVQAGAPTYSELIRQGKKQRPPVFLSDSSLSDWLNGTSTPSNPGALLFLVTYMQPKARLRSGYKLRRPEWWEQLRLDAVHERNAARGGRPHRRRRSSTSEPPRPHKLPQDTPGQLLRSAYLEQVREIAPDTLVGRDSELAEWARFCVGSETYAWWQADPWAGKTALASWFVTHPPPGVDIVSFFITGRLSGQADSDAFLDAMIEQLRALDPAGWGPPAVTGARVGAWLNLLASAAGHADEQSRRLVVVVDGLDEDDVGAFPRRGRPSIASLLPRRPPSGVRFIVTSRPDPGLPDDVPADHLLRTCDVHCLPVSWVAQDLAIRAEQELRDLLIGDQIPIDVVGYIAASGGGLTRSDLSALTGASPLRLGPILRGVSGRSLQTRTSVDFRNVKADPVSRVYLFAHETLRVTAEEQLGGELARYRQLIHDWISSYADLGWPNITPGYAIRGYPGLLIATGDAMRLSGFACDSRRHAFSCGLPEATMLPSLRLGMRRNSPRLRTSLTYRPSSGWPFTGTRYQSVTIRSQWTFPWCGRGSIVSTTLRLWPTPSPTRTPGQRRSPIWPLPLPRPAILDRADRLAADAEAIARIIIEDHAKAYVLIELAAAAAQVGDPDRAHRLAVDAEAVARAIDDQDFQAAALTYLVTAAVQGGDLDRAEALARAITAPTDQAKVLAELVTSAAKATDLDHAEALARTITDQYFQSRALAGLATAAAEIGDLDRAHRLITEAEAMARSIAGAPYAQATMLGEVAIAAARAGDPDGAEDLINTITDQYAKAQALIRLVTTTAQTGDPDRACRMAADAEVLACTIDYPYFQVRALTELAAAVGQVGDPDRAERLATDAGALAHTVTDSGDLAKALADLITASAQVGGLDRAEDLINTITDQYAKAQALIRLVTTAAQVGDLDRAEAMARTIVDPGYQVEALTDLAAVALEADDLERAERIATDVETLARTITNGYAQAEALTWLVTAATQAGDPDLAEALARTITDPSRQAEALAKLAVTTAQAGDPDRAEALARTITDPSRQAEALAKLAVTAVQADDPDRACRLVTDAEAVVLSLTSTPYRQEEALSEAATAAALLGDLDRAEALARAVPEGYAQARALERLAVTMAQAGDLDRAVAVASTITEPSVSQPDHQARALAQLAIVAAQAGDRDRADRIATDAWGLARTITDYGTQLQALFRLATAAAQVGDQDRAEAVALTIHDPEFQAETLAKLAVVAVEAGNLDRAETLAHALTYPGALALAAIAAAQAGDSDRADRMAADAETLARTVTDPHYRAEELAEVAAAFARVGDLDRAETLARTITSLEIRVKAFTDLATVAAQVGDSDRADRMAIDAESLACTITDPGYRAEALANLAAAAAQAGDPDGARHLMALALSAESEIGWWIRAAARSFPSAIRGARNALISAYKTNV